MGSTSRALGPFDGDVRRTIERRGDAKRIVTWIATSVPRASPSIARVVDGSTPRPTSTREVSCTYVVCTSPTDSSSAAEKKLSWWDLASLFVSKTNAFRVFSKAMADDQDVPEACPGVGSERAGKEDACQGCPNRSACADGSAKKQAETDAQKVAARLKDVRHVVLVLSGKGGVGKSTFSAQLAYALASQGKEVGLLDVDICGPSIPTMLGLEGQEVHQSNLGWSPVYVDDNLGVMSIGFLLNNKDEAVVWRGPRKNSLIKQFLQDVDWAELDYLVVDTPPGTSDEHISLAQLLHATDCVDGAVVVSTPQDVAVNDVRKELDFCKKVGLRVLGVVENMAGLQMPWEACRIMDPHTGKDRTDELKNALAKVDPSLLSSLVCSDVFSPGSRGVLGMCEEAKAPYLGKIPLDPAVCIHADQGVATRGPAALALQHITTKLMGILEGKEEEHENHRNGAAH